MNGSTTFDHGKAISTADQIISIANRVEGLFSETDAEIAKLQQNWQSTTNQDSASNAIALYNQYKANFNGFLAQIKNKATEIHNSSETYAGVEAQANKEVDAGYQINNAA